MAITHVIVDGSNIATEGRTTPSLAQLDEAVRALLDEFGDVKLTVVVDATFGHRIDESERDEFEAGIVNGELVTPPAGAIGRGDAFILQVADKVNATVFSNDSFQEFHGGQYDWLFDEGRLLGAKPVPAIGWVFVWRTPVRGPTSRRATREARSPKRGTSSGSELAKLPLPMPTSPPPGARRSKKAASGQSESARPAKKAAGASKKTAAKQPAKRGGGRGANSSPEPETGGEGGSSRNRRRRPLGRQGVDAHQRADALHHVREQPSRRLARRSDGRPVLIARRVRDGRRRAVLHPAEGNGGPRSHQGTRGADGRRGPDLRRDGVRHPASGHRSRGSRCGIQRSVRAFCNSSPRGRRLRWGNPTSRGGTQHGSDQEGSGQEGRSEEGSGQEGRGEEGSGQEGSGQEGRAKKAPAKKAAPRRLRPRRRPRRRLRPRRLRPRRRRLRPRRRPRRRRAPAKKAPAKKADPARQRPPTATVREPTTVGSVPTSSLVEGRVTSRPAPPRVGDEPLTARRRRRPRSWRSIQRIERGPVGAPRDHEVVEHPRRRR